MGTTKEEVLGKVLSMVTLAPVGIFGVFGKVWAIVMSFLNYVRAFPKDDVDWIIDQVEAANSQNSLVMGAMKVVRIILACPDEDINQQEPI